MKNTPLQQAIITSLIQKSCLLTEEKKTTLLERLPMMTAKQLEELQQLIGSEERVVLHPRDLGIEEIIAAADPETLRTLGALVDDSLTNLRTIEVKTFEDMDTLRAKAILSKLS